MTIAVLNGSPKGEKSVTMQYVKYLELENKQHDFIYIHAARRCTAFEKNPQIFDEALAKVEQADLVLWAFPLYFLLVHSQYKRFIELIFERNKQKVFAGKPAASLSTSIHFFDNTANTYIGQISEALGMSIFGSFQAHMHDLLEEKGQNDIRTFFTRFTGEFVPSGDDSPVVTIVSDAGPEDTALIKMIERMKSHFPNAEIMDLQKIKMGPCLGCVKCGMDNRCAYEGKDEFIEEHRRKILPADIVIYALPVRDRYFSHRWQRYLERSFYLTHQPTIEGKQTAVLVSGDFSGNENSRTILTGYLETNGAHLAGIISAGTTGGTDLDSANVPHQIDKLARDLRFCAENNTSKPKSFLGTAGMTIFRDEIYGGLRFIFQKDHSYYRKNGIYNFPQRKIGRRIAVGIIVLLSKLPPVRKQIRLRSKQEMIKPYQKVLSSVKN